MGARGLAYPLVHLRDGEPDAHAVLEAVRSALRGEWFECDHGESGAAELASAWLDDTLTVELQGDEVCFWFNESVEWPSALAEHWLEVALASGRTGIDGVLAAQGVALAASKNLPTLETHLFQPTEPPRLVRSGKVWRLDRARSLLVAEASLTGGTTPNAELALDVLDEEQRARLARGRCDCPICRGIFDTELGAESLASGAAGWRVERVERWPYTMGVRLHTVRGGHLVALASTRPVVYIQRGTGDHQRVALPFSANGPFLCATFAAGPLAAFAVSTAGCAQSEDGVTWTARSDLGGFDGCAARPFGAAGADLAVWSNSARTLLLSRDGGVTFDARSFPAPIVQLSFALAVPDVAYAVVTRDDGTTALVRSDDALRTWQQRASLAGGDVRAVLVGRDANTVTVLGATNTLRSTDGGATFAPVWAENDRSNTGLVDADGRLFVSRGYGTIELSLDDGATWSTIANDGAQSLAAVAGSRDLTAATYHVQFRLIAPD